MKSNISQKAKGPTDFVTFSFNPGYFQSVDDDLYMKNVVQSETKYKFELGGMLVYDLKARIINQNDNLNEVDIQNKVNSGIKKKNTTKFENSDYAAFNRMKYCAPDPVYPCEYLLEVPDDQVTLKFDSRFESGNLEKAVKITDYEYILYLHSDTNTSEQNHWYYFSVFNPRKTSINFKITNMIKKDLLYLSGMKPCTKSKKSFELNGILWERDGYNITYTQNKEDAKNLNFIGSKKYYTLSFTYDFKYENDLVYFAYAIPYTYTQLSLYLSELKYRYPNILRVTPLCKTLGGNICEMITITSSIKDYFSFEEEAQDWNTSSNTRKISKIKAIKKKTQEQKAGTYKTNKHENKKGIVLTARVHSGETVSSYMMRGAIEFLVSANRSAKLLRKNFVFKIIPMLNPDGCKYGNYRCSLLGVDLNRRWDHTNKELHPTIYYAKKMIEAFNEKHEIMMVCDMHGHTKKRNVFMYGCGVQSHDSVDSRKNLLARVVPYIMSLRNNFFSYKDSHFRIENNRKATARVFLWENYNICHSYTMEASFYGPSKPKAFGETHIGDLHMNEKHLETLGTDLCKICLIFSNKALYMKKVEMTNEFLRNLLIQKIRNYNKHTNHGSLPIPVRPRSRDKKEENLDKAISNSIRHSSYIDVSTKNENINKKNKKNEIIEVQQLEDIQIIEIDDATTQIFEEEALWDQIEIVKIDPDSESSGSDSDCSLEYCIENKNTKFIKKNEENQKVLEIKKKVFKLPIIRTPQPIEPKKIKSKSRNQTHEKTKNLQYPNSIPSPKNIISKKITENLLFETPIIPQVFIFPEKKMISENSSESFVIFKKSKDSVHKNEEKSIYHHMPKKIYKLKPKWNNLSYDQNYDKSLNKKNTDVQDTVKISLETKQIFSKIKTHKLLNDFFNSCTLKNSTLALAISSKYKLENMHQGNE